MPAIHPRKPPTRPCDPASKQRHDIADAKAPAASDLRNIANDTTHAYAVSGERIWGWRRMGGEKPAGTVMAARATGAATQTYLASILRAE